MIMILCGVVAQKISINTALLIFAFSHPATLN